MGFWVPGACSFNGGGISTDGVSKRYEIGPQPSDSKEAKQAKNAGMAPQYPSRAGRKRKFGSTADKQKAYRNRRNSSVTKLTGEILCQK